MSNLPKKIDKINVRVAVRVRPMSDTERADNATSIVKVEEKKMKVACKLKTFSAFDKVYGPSTTQERVYAEMVSPQVERVLAGYNCTLFAYGQTGTGKTYTMEGGSGERGSYKDDPTTGIIPRAVEHIFEELEKSNTDEYSVRVSYLELYNEELYDLLAPTSDDRERLRIFDDPSKKGMVVISGAEEIPVKNRGEVYRLLKTGAEKRMTAATLMNMNSSRSHSIFTVNVVVRENTVNGEELVKQGKLNLVDLAGSEHIGRSGAEGKRAKEAGNINQSLLTLGRVITALTTSAPHVPYRESKLTRLLQDSLGGATITSIIATLSPASTNYEETISTLEYAARAKSIRNHPECNQKLSRKALLKEYNEEIEQLRRDLRSAREKNGIFLSQESYQGMEKEIAEKTEQLTELEGQLDGAIGKLQKFIEDQEIMDEQYRQLYHRNKRLESKLEQRVNELDETKKDLAKTTGLLNSTKGALDQVHNIAKKLSETLKETRHVVYDQQFEMEDWWNKEELLLQLNSQNRQLAVATRCKVIPTINNCCEALSGHLSTSADLRNEINKQIETDLSEASGYLDQAEVDLRRADSTFQRKIAEVENQCQSAVSRTVGYCDEFDVVMKENMNTAISMTEEISELSANMKNEAANLSKIFEELRKESQSMLTRRREMIEEDRSHRAVNVPALRKQQERTSKIVELAHAIVTECNQYQQENCSILDAMESHDQDVFEKNITDLETWESAFQGLEDVAMEALSAMNETNSRTADLSSSRKFSIPCVLKETASTASQLNKSVKKETDTFMAGIQSLNKSSYDDVKNFMISIGQYCNELRNLTCETENKRLVTQKEEANREQNIVQTVRDHLGNINEYVTSMTDEHWLHPQSSGKTPKKVHRQVASDDDIPRVPKMRKILESNGFYTETPRKSSFRTRESLLEVQNICLSPDTLAANRKARLEDISEESGNTTTTNRSSEKSKFDLEN